MLEVEEAEIRKLPDDEFTVAYLAYRRRVEEMIRYWTNF